MAICKVFLQTVRTVVRRTSVDNDPSAEVLIRM